MSGRTILLSLIAGFIVLTSFSAFTQVEEPPSCPSAKAASKPNWFRGFPVPEPKGKLTVNVVVSHSVADCTGLPAEITVPNHQVVTLHVVYPEDYTCSTTFVESPVTSSSPVPELIASLAKLGVISALGFDQGETTSTRDLPSLSSEVMTATVKCTKDKQATLIENVKITYQNPPRVTGSAGLVVARGVASYGVKTVETGLGTGGVITTQNTVARTSLPTAQVIPFTFANIYWIGSQTKHIDSQIGFGVNPNLSTPRVELFASPIALSWHDVYLSPGIHIGEHEVLANDFTLGGILPSGVSKIPINWKWYSSFGFSLSYNLHPLIKGK